MLLKKIKIKFNNCLLTYKHRCMKAVRIFTKLYVVYRLMNIKAINRCSDKGFITLLQAMHEMLPKAKFPLTTYQAKNLMCSMWIEIDKIKAFPNDCMLYRDNDEDLHACWIGGKSR